MLLANPGNQRFLAIYGLKYHLHILAHFKSIRYPSKRFILPCNPFRWFSMDFVFPLGFRFDPTNDELIQYLQWRHKDLNDPRIAFISNIVMGVHEPSEFDALCTVKGKDGIMYFFALWDSYGKAGRLERQVKKDSMKATWKEVSKAVEIKSSDGTKIGTWKNFTFKVDDSLTEWHMEEYRLSPEHQHSKVSICRVSKKCSQPRRTTKIDAKVDNVDHLCPQAMDSGREINEGQEDGGLPSWCDLRSGWHAPKGTGYSCYQNELTTSSPLNDENLQNGRKVAEEYGHFMEEEYGHFREVENPDGGPSSRCNVWSGLHTPKETGYSYSDNLPTTSPPLNVTTFVDNRDAGNCQSANDTVLNMNDDENLQNGRKVAEEYGHFMEEEYGHFREVDNPDGGPSSRCNLCSGLHTPKETGCYHNLFTTSAPLNVDNRDAGNCQSANDTVLNMNDDENLQNGRKVAEEYSHFMEVDIPDTGNCQIVDDTVPDMDDRWTGNCVSCPDHRIFFDTSEDFLQLELPTGFEGLENVFQG